MPTIGPKSGGTFASSNLLGNIAITNPSNAASSDNNYAFSILVLNDVTHYLKVTNFQMNVPIHSTIDGVLVEVERNTTIPNSIQDNSIKLVLPSGNLGSQEKSAAAMWSTSDAYSSFGSLSDIWGETLTPIMVNDVNFGVCLSALAVIAGTAQIDHVRMSVAYTPLSVPAAIKPSVTVSGNLSKSGG